MNNYNQLFKQEVASLNHRPRLLFHVCCGVCSVYPLLLLDQYFDVTVYYANSNIAPDEEYDLREKELERYRQMIAPYHQIELVVPKRDMAAHIYQLTPYKDEKEGGERCRLCYALRLEESFAYAAKEGYEYCGTVMSVSNRKKADMMNEILNDLSVKYPDVKPLFADFKKDKGILINEKCNKKIGLYHQTYCGCPYSENYPHKAQ